MEIKMEHVKPQAEPESSVGPGTHYVERLPRLQEAVPPKVALAERQHDDHALSEGAVVGQLAPYTTRVGTGPGPYALHPRATASDIVDAVEQVIPAGIHLVGVVVHGGTNVPWWSRRAESVALWLLKRTGFTVYQ